MNRLATQWLEEEIVVVGIEERSAKTISMSKSQWGKPTYKRARTLSLTST